MNANTPATKTLFVFVEDGCDGSYSPRFTFNAEWVAKQQERYDNGELDYEDMGIDGDGFHYTTLTVPAECTLESLGISFDCAE